MPIILAFSRITNVLYDLNISETNISIRCIESAQVYGHSKSTGKISRQELLFVTFGVVLAVASIIVA